MRDDIVIKFEDVWKEYYIHTEKRPTSLKNALFSGFSFLGKQEKISALKGVNFEIPKGKTLGLIGRNGAGKSTLLRLISGISKPTKGRVLVRGNLGTLLELGAGLNVEFTGRENIITGSLIAGFTRKEALHQIDKVIEFSELGDFIDAPLRTYSSGMFTRLAFSTQIMLNPDVLLVDEVLAVGDLAFQRKCYDYLLGMKTQGKTLLIVSHSMEEIATVCDEIIWLEAGVVRAQGETKEIVTLYKNRLFENTTQFLREMDKAETTGDLEVLSAGQSGNIALAPAPTEVIQKSGTLEVDIESVAVLNDLGQTLKSLLSGDPLVVVINYEAEKPVPEPIFMVTIRDSEDTIVYEIGTNEEGLSPDVIEGRGTLGLTFPALPLLKGIYTISVGIHERNWERMYCYIHKAAEIEIEGNTPGKGFFALPHRWQV